MKLDRLDAALCLLANESVGEPPADKRLTHARRPLKNDVLLALPQIQNALESVRTWSLSHSDPSLIDSPDQLHTRLMSSRFFLAWMLLGHGKT